MQKLQSDKCTVGQNRRFTPYVWSSPQGIFANLYGVFIRFWPTLTHKWSLPPPGAYEQEHLVLTHTHTNIHTRPHTHTQPAQLCSLQRAKWRLCCAFADIQKSAGSTHSFFGAILTLMGSQKMGVCCELEIAVRIRHVYQVFVGLARTIYVHSACTVILAGKSPNIWCTYGSGQPYLHALSQQHAGARVCKGLAHPSSSLVHTSYF